MTPRTRSALLELAAAHAADPADREALAFYGHLPGHLADLDHQAPELAA